MMKNQAIANTHQSETIDAALPRIQDNVTSPRGGARWQWYHYYFLLAIVDVLVIAASVLLIHRTTASYEIALQKLSTTHSRQRWVASLRLRVMKLNAPGNDVFETHRFADERARFEQSRAALEEDMERHRDFEIDLAEFQSHLDKMIHEEERIFELLESALHSNPDDDSVLNEASRSMAAMDRYQSLAITALTEIEQGFLMRVESLLREHGSRIKWHASLEWTFIVLICIILASMFWYGRKLQRLHEDMTLQHKRAQDERLARLAAVGEVCASVAHGIRNPLASISSSAQLGLATDGFSEMGRSRLQDILSECQRLNDRVTHLLSFASSTSTTQQPFKLRDVVEQAVAELAPRLRERGVDVQLTFTNCPLIHGDRERMVQCMIELLSNALDFSPKNGRVTVQCAYSASRPGFVDLEVSDQGPGIPPHMTDRVFDLFFTTRAGGTGVGLASVRHTIQSLGGEVMVVPNEATGCRIRVTLPARI